MLTSRLRGGFGGRTHPVAPPSSHSIRVAMAVGIDEPVPGSPGAVDRGFLPITRPNDASDLTPNATTQWLCGTGPECP